MGVIVNDYGVLTIGLDLWVRNMRTAPKCYFGFYWRSGDWRVVKIWDPIEFKFDQIHLKIDPIQLKFKPIHPAQNLLMIRCMNVYLLNSNWSLSFPGIFRVFLPKNSFYLILVNLKKF